MPLDRDRQPPKRGLLDPAQDLVGEYTPPPTDVEEFNRRLWSLRKLPAQVLNLEHRISLVERRPSETHAAIQRRAEVYAFLVGVAFAVGAMLILNSCARS